MSGIALEQPQKYCAHTKPRADNIAAASVAEPDPAFAGFLNDMGAETEPSYSRLDAPAATQTPRGTEQIMAALP